MKKDKSVIYGAIAGFLLFAILIGFRACKSVAKLPKPGKNEYGFKSVFVDDDYDEEDKLGNFPAMKEAMLALEPKILGNDLEIEQITYSKFSLRGTYYLGGDDKIIINFTQDKDTNEYKWHSVECEVFENNEKYLKVAEAMCAFADISDEETKLIKELKEEDHKDEVQTMKYYINYDEGEKEVFDSSTIQVETQTYEEFLEAQENVKKLKCQELSISDNPAESERSTTIYAVKREERRPKADGEDIDISGYGLSLFIPNGFTANEYNGMLYVWEYYTGSYVGSYPDGVDVTIKINGFDEGKDFDTYVRNDSRPAKSTGVTPFVTKEINGHTWYTCNNGTIYYYGAEFMGNAYEIETKNGKTYNGITLQNTLDMMEKTLFFE